MSQDNTLDEKESKYQKRPRYKVTHPKNYKEKYNEHNPDKYAEDSAKIIKKGNTPSGMHISICAKEILDFLQIKPGQTDLDCTLGYEGQAYELPPY